MNAFLKFFAHQKKLALIFTLSIIVLGVIALQDIQRDQFPSAEFSSLTISTSYPNASPQDVEKNITNVIEAAIKSISGIEKITSTSREGVSSISVNISPDVIDISAVKAEITETVNGIRSLPGDIADNPLVIDRKFTERPVLTIVIDGKSVDMDVAERIANDLEKNLTLIDGVSSVDISGDSTREIQIQIDPDKLLQYQLSFDQVSSAIARQNVRSTIGDNNQGEDKKSIVILSEYTNTQSIENVIVKSSYDAPLVYLKDIAIVSEGAVGSQSITRINGTTGYILKVRKSENADIIHTVEQVREKVYELEQYYPSELNLIIADDQSTGVANRLKIVTNNAILGLIFIMIVLGCFLSLKTAFWVAISIPVALLGTVAFLGFSGETINLISLTAMILVLGIVVDDSIIIAESIHHFKAQGGNVYENVVAGFKRVILPVFTTILTTVLAMSTMFMMSGTLGKFIYILPITVICALVLSVLEVSFALPAHLAGQKNEKQKTWFKPVERWFEKQLKKLLKWRYSVVTFFIALLIYSSFFAVNNMSFITFPSDGTNSISMRIEMAAGTSASTTEQAVIQVENIIIEQTGGILDFFTSSIGSRETNKATISIALIPSSDRDVSAAEILKILQATVINVEGIEVVKSRANREGPNAGSDIEINLIGSNDAQRESAIAQLKEILMSMPGVGDIDTGEDPGNSRIEVVLDYEAMARLGVDYQQVYSHLRTIYSGKNVTDVQFDNTNLNVKMYLGDNNYSENYIPSTQVRSGQGMMIPMSEFSTIIEIPGEPDYRHLNGERVITISAAVDDSTTTAQVVMRKALQTLDVGSNYPGVRIVEGGNARQATQTLDDFYFALGFAVFGIFMIVSLLFNSYSQPLLVLASVPFSMIGVLWAFVLHGEPFSFVVAIGVLALVGVIVNDSLVMISHLNYLKSKQDKVSTSINWIAEGSKDRLRAVVLTTLTTLAGVLPLAYGIGGTDAFLQPMVLALGYGLLFGTLITLVLLPCLYLMNYDFINWLTGLKSKYLTKTN
ncbi:MAG TPA: efflux RND transporter permease subunit [Candidatus Thioglobus sp.]|jgi:multidrug efflux pump subunit AcrB|nr:efflux RND transporter permease subunit [Candidatus Thioglobus sp.]